MGQTFADLGRTIDHEHGLQPIGHSQAQSPAQATIERVKLSRSEVNGCHISQRTVELLTSGGSVKAVRSKANSPFVHSEHSPNCSPPLRHVRPDTPGLAGHGGIFLPLRQTSNALQIPTIWAPG
jgi:hypothetical protein